MIAGELLTRLTIWMALACYSVSVGLGLLRPERGRRWARYFWTSGLAFFLVHVTAAFHYYYDWSHTVGINETARQTRELTGVDSGSGLYLNYLFSLVWLSDGVYWWVVGVNRYASRPRWVSGTVHGFFIFMIVNGAVVFVKGPTRWIGCALLVGLAAAWLYRQRKGLDRA